MKKLLELKSLDTEVRELLYTVKRPPGIYICAHMHYLHPKVSIYMENLENKLKLVTTITQGGVVFEVDNEIDEQIADEIIAQIEKVMQ